MRKSGARTLTPAIRNEPRLVSFDRASTPAASMITDAGSVSLRFHLRNKTLVYFGQAGAGVHEHHAGTPLIATATRQ